MTIYYLLSATLIMIFAQSCEIINPVEDIPSYIYIDTIELKINNSALGENTSKITDAWVYHDNELIGIYDLPSRIPVLDSDSTDILIAAGIMSNGKVNSRLAYPFYKIYNEKIFLKTAKIETLDVKIDYFDQSALNLFVMEDFEFGNSLEKFSGDTSIIKVSGELALNNNSSGYIYMDTTYNDFSIISSDHFELPNAGSTLFLEMDYKCTNNFSVGLVVDNDFSYEERYKLTLVDKENWNKIYINLSDKIYGNQNNKYHLLIGGILDNNKESGEIFIDNLKLISFN